MSQEPEYEPYERWTGPITTAFPSNTTWKLKTESHYLGSYTVQKLTQLRTHHKMKAPPSQQAREARLGIHIKWQKVWRLKCHYTTPKDEVTWLKLIHRNLYVANRDPQAANHRFGSKKGLSTRWGVHSPSPLGEKNHDLV